MPTRKNVNSYQVVKAARDVASPRTGGREFEVGVEGNFEICERSLQFSVSFQGWIGMLLFAWYEGFVIEGEDVDTTCSATEGT